jgi:hypothetical protein
MVGFLGGQPKLRDKSVNRLSVTELTRTRSFANECADPASCWLRPVNPEAIGSKVPLLFRLRADRVEIAIDVVGPEGR